MRLPAAERREVIERAASEVFAERGYQAASMAEIANRSGVSVPVLYDHFRSKLDLHRRLLERHFAELRALWRRHAAAGPLDGERLAAALDEWFGYVQTHPYAARMLFADSSGDSEVRAVRAQAASASRDELLPLLAGQLAAGKTDRPPAPQATPGGAGLELTWEVVRAVLQGLALWWSEHPEVPREEIVRTAMNGLWIGLERVSGGERWP